MTNNMMTAIYCRLALKDDARIEVQKAKVLRYATEQEHSNVCVYVDNGASGNTLDRQAFKEMNTDIAAGKINTVVVLSIDRFGRTAEARNWINEMRNKGITIKTTDSSLDEGSDPYDDFIRSINLHIGNVS